MGDVEQGMKHVMLPVVREDANTKAFCLSSAFQALPPSASEQSSESLHGLRNVGKCEGLVTCSLIPGLVTYGPVLSPLTHVMLSGVREDANTKAFCLSSAFQAPPPQKIPRSMG